MPLVSGANKREALASAAGKVGSGAYQCDNFSFFFLYWSCIGKFIPGDDSVEVLCLFPPVSSIIGDYKPPCIYCCKITCNNGQGDVQVFLL